jgi:hypothetical protein
MKYHSPIDQNRSGHGTERQIKRVWPGAFLAK